MFEVAEYKVRFHHKRYEPAALPFVGSKVRGHTYCQIIRENLEVPAVRGTTYCSAKDQFNYNTGRKIALSRALKAAGFDKPTRSLFWEAYFKKRGKVE